MMMQALQLVERGKPLELRTVPEAALGDDDVTITVMAAGICRSDVHYRTGFPEVGPLPLTLGHEVAGTVAAVGAAVDDFAAGDRVCVHYQIGCGACDHCRRGFEQFCPTGKMIGNGRPGGYAERITVPARNVVPVPEAVPLDHAAVMMCSSATSLHALRKGRVAPGDKVAVFGAGGLGMSAIQLALLEGAEVVYAVDLNTEKLEQAAALGAKPVAAGDSVETLLPQGGVDVALDLVGSAEVMRQCLESLAPMGRAVAVGLTAATMPVGPYTDLVTGESELIGASDHLKSEIEELLQHAAARRLQLEGIVGNRIPLDADAVNAALDELEAFQGPVRTVIRPRL
jgi:propanol-preferring alcohol dehydrogenase